VPDDLISESLAAVLLQDPFADGPASPPAPPQGEAPPASASPRPAQRGRAREEGSRAAPPLAPASAHVPDDLPEATDRIAQAQSASAGPPTLASPRRGRPDRLQQLDGVTPRLESRLNRLGIWHFSQIAAWSPEQAGWVATELGDRAAADIETWVRSARALLERRARMRAASAERPAPDIVPDPPPAWPAAAPGPSVPAMPDPPAPVVMAPDSPRRPGNLRKEPREGTGDDLKRLAGVTRAHETRLKTLGLWHFDQFADLSAAELDWLSSFLGAPGLAQHHDWPAQARLLLATSLPRVAQA
jgi:predicted flap endonuclease-1-like 5' DNA nuclease